MTDIGRMQLRVYNPISGIAWGPYSAPILDEDGTWWSTIIFGEMIGLEFILPRDVPTPVEMPTIQSIFHMYRDFSSSADLHGPCLLDAACYPEWIDSEGQAVALLLCSTGCTGALLNRRPTDGAPIVMTARHCLSTQREARRLCVIWFYENETCDGGDPPDMDSLPRNDGALVLKTDLRYLYDPLSPSTDWTLLGLYELAGAAYYLGWDPNPWDDFSYAVGIHHSASKPKRICFGLKYWDSHCSAARSSAQWYVQWDDDEGHTKAGASGSPVFDYYRRVRGTLSCGDDDASCSKYNKYGRFDKAYPMLQFYIDGMANPTYVDGSVPGDWRNSGFSERGTSSYPFNTVYEGTFCVPGGGSVRIKPGNYNERFTLWRPMTLRREGSSGVVRIGTTGASPP